MTKLHRDRCVDCVDVASVGAFFPRDRAGRRALDPARSFAVLIRRQSDRFPLAGPLAHEVPSDALSNQ